MRNSYGTICRPGVTPVLAALAVLAFALAPSASAEDASSLEGYTEPYRTINVATSQTGILDQLRVREGDHVNEGQILGALDNDVHAALLAVAKAGMEAHGERDSAQAELGLRQRRLEALEKLLTDGHARPEEVERARTDLAIAEAHVQTALEDKELKTLEYTRIRLQMEQRSIRAPLAGEVTTIYKQRGEFLAPNEPVLLRLVELDPLRVTFFLSRPQADLLRIDSQVRVSFVAGNQTVVGAVEFVSPVTDAESGTVSVKVRLANPGQRLHGGERCRLVLPPVGTVSGSGAPPIGTKS